MRNSKKLHRVMEQLEDRVLFDAVPDGGFLIQPESADQPLFDQQQMHGVDSILQAEQQPRELILVDSNVEQADVLIAGILESNPDRVFEVRLLDADQDGIQQITEILDAAKDPYKAIHVLSHGSAGNIQLGSSLLNSENLSGYAGEIAGWADGMTDEADLLFYGCNLAGNQAGAAFVETLGTLTGADVAASDDLTGAAKSGGDWELETRFGNVETESLSSANFDGVLVVTDSGFVVGTKSFATMSETAVVPVGQPGTSSVTYAGAATAGGGAITIDLRLTLVDTFDENGNITTGTANQLPVTFTDFAGGPIILARTPGASVSGYEGHTAHIVIEFFDQATGNPISVVGDFSFKDIDYEPPSASGSGSEAVTVNSLEIAEYHVSSVPASDIDVIDNGDGTTTFTNTTSSGGENDEQRWARIKFDDMPQLSLTFTARNANTGYGLSTTNFSFIPVINTQPVATDDNFATDQDTNLSGNVVTSDNGNGVDSDPDGDPITVWQVDGDPANLGNPATGSNGGSFIVNADGSFSFSPNGDFDYLAAGESTTTSITYSIDDGAGNTDTATITVTVNGINDTPIVATPTADQTDLDSDLINLDVSGNFSDVDGDMLTFSATGLPPGLSISAAGSITGTLDSAPRPDRPTRS